MAEGDSTQRSRLDADHVTSILREQGVANLRTEAELALVLDGMELRRPGAHEQEYLMPVKALDGSLVNGYRSFTVLGMGQAARGLLYHKLISSNTPDFGSENVAVKAAIHQAKQALAGFEGAKTWAIDMGFDNDEVWWEVWSHPHSHMVNRVYTHGTDCGVANCQWEERYLDATFPYLKHLASIETELDVRLQGQRYAKRPTVTVAVPAVPIRVYHPADKSQTKPVWLARAKAAGAVGKPWYLLTDWPVNDADSALRIFRFYRRRWSVEDTFKFIKTSCGSEEVQMLSFEAVRRLAAYGWVAAGFLFHLGLTLEQPEVR